MDLRVRAKKSSEKKSVPACNFYRETGLYHKTTGPPKYLQWAAEEKLIHKNHEEFVSTYRRKELGVTYYKAN